MTRVLIPTRRAGMTAVALAATLLVSSCGDSTAQGSDAADPGQDTGAFPVTLDGAYGKVTVEEKPERIVALTGQYADMLHTIDQSPVAYSADVPSADALASHAPWLAEDLGTETLDVELVSSDYTANLEKIASYEPDLILGVTWSISEDLYQQVSQIAPTFVGVEEGNNDWEVLFDSLGSLTGETEAVNSAKRTLDEEFAKAREELPGLQGKTYQMTAFDGEKFWFGNGSWLEGLGLKPAANQDNSQTRGEDIALENLDQLDADVLSIYDTEGDRTSLGKDPRFQELPASKHGAVVFSDLSMATAANGPGPLSLTWVLDKTLPELRDSDLNGQD